MPQKMTGNKQSFFPPPRGGSHIPGNMLICTPSSPLPMYRYFSKIIIHSLPLLALACSTTRKAEPHAWLDDQLYSAQGHLYKNVARIKNPAKTIVRFSPAQVRKIKSLLKPGDVMLSYTAGYMSNVFLPGTFKHSILYVGDAEARERIGLTMDALAATADDGDEARRMLAAAEMERLPSGEEADVIEAVAEGVRVYSLEKLLATHINRLVVLRPRLTREQRKNQVAGLYSYVGKPYDFRFDFTDNTRNYCSELVYRTLEPSGSFDFQLTKQRGHWVLTADDIINYYLHSDPESFDFVLLAERGQPNGHYDAAIHTGDKGRTRLDRLMEGEDNSRAQIRVARE